MSDISTPRTYVTGEFNVITGIIEAGTTTPEQLAALQEKITGLQRQVDARLNSRIITPDQAREILGDKLFFGIDSANKLYGTNLAEADIAHIPFNLTLAEAENAARLGHIVSLHVPFTMLDIHEHIATTQKKTIVYNVEEIVRNGSAIFARTRDFFEWRETSVKLVPETFRKDYLVQTDLLIQYLQEEIYQGKPIPTRYETAIQEFEQRKPAIIRLIERWDDDHASGRENWYVATEILADLKITQLLRPTPISIMQDITNLKSVGANMLENESVWTSARFTHGGFVCVGFSSDLGAQVYARKPNDGHVFFGASLSRSLSK